MSDYSFRLRGWVNDQWPQLNVNDFAVKTEWHQPSDKAPEWQALTGDAGFRRYFRLASTPSLLAVFAPPETENMTAFIDIAHYLRTHGVLVPAIAAFDKKQGFMLIEDLGSDLLYKQLNPDNVEALYAESLKSLLQIQLAPPEGALFPMYSEAKLQSEMGLFVEWFVPKLLGYKMTGEEEQLVEQLFFVLTHSAKEQPQVVVHRDFHSRNLIYRPDGPPGVIDFQDAVIGPITYDLVSLLRDCYIQWPDEDVKKWALSYFSIAVQAGLAESVDDQTFLQWFDWMGLQRHIKVLGIFARLSLRDDKHGYLNDLPLVIEYVLQVSKSYPQTHVFAAWFEQKLMPLVEQQSWYMVNKEKEI